MGFIAEVSEGILEEGEAGGLPARHPQGSGPFKHEPYHLGSATPSALLALCPRPRALEDFLEFLQQPSCKVVLGTALVLGGGGLMLWAQRRKRKTECARDKSPHSCRSNDSWIKSHFSCLSEERLPTHRYVSNNGPSYENRHGEANTTFHMETLTSKHGEGNMALHRDSFASKQKVSGTSVTKETQRESRKPSSMEDETWAAVAACAKEIDAKGHHLANSMLQRATTYQHIGHAESRDISPEELKALEEVEIKLKRNFLTQRETSIAGSNQSHTIYSQSRHGHQNQHRHSNHQSNQSHPVYSSHQGHHPDHLSHQGHPSYSSHQSHQGHLGYSSHQSHQSHLGHSNHQGHQGHSSHQSHQGQPGHASHQSHSLPNRSHQIYDS